MARHAHEGEAGAVAGEPPSAGAAAPAGGGPAAVEHRLKRTERQPERSCIVTREVRPPSELIRFVLSPDGAVTPDIGRALPGRGVWVTAGRGYVEEAVKRKVFARALKAQAQTPADLADLVSRLLRKGALQALSLANKSGAVIAGFEKVRAAVASGEAAALVEAADGSPEGRRKLLSVRRAPPVDGIAEGLAEELPVIDLFASADLDLALGRSH